MTDPQDKIYDFVVIGSGLGGLLCSYLLAERGYSVCILEKNVQFGGCLQIFSREKSIFDTGVHYIGELGPGENLHKIFSYFGLMDHLKLEQLDRDAFDVVSFRDDPTEYPLAQGHENFVEQLSAMFPNERQAIEQYARKLNEVSSDFYTGDFKDLDLDFMNRDAMRTSAKEYIASLTTNEKLRDVLAGNIPVYAGVGNRTPLHQHALILNSYINSAWRCVDGGAQIAKHLASAIRSKGGTLLRRREVSQLHVEDGEVSSVETKSGEVFKARNFVANIPPENIVNMLRGVELRKSYVKRLTEQEPGASFFGLYLKFKPGSFPYLKSNYYHYNRPGVWDAVEYDPQQWPESWLLYPSASSAEGEYMETATILAYMDYDEVKQWSGTHNTTAHPKDRGEAYADFKKQKADRLLESIEKRFPGFRGAIQSYYTSTPLTYRDYLGVKKGAAYGKVKDFHQPHQAFISPRSRINNLFFTGQHIHLHGIKGVTTTAILTASVILKDSQLYSKVKRGKVD